MAVFTHPCGEGLGVLLLVAEGAGLGLGAGLEPAEESSAREISGCSSTRDRGEDRRFSPGVGVDPELEPLAVDVVRQRLDPVRERLGVGHQIALRRPAPISFGSVKLRIQTSVNRLCVPLHHVLAPPSSHLAGEEHIIMMIRVNQVLFLLYFI